MSDTAPKPFALAQRGRASLEILGSLQRFSSSALRSAARKAFDETWSGGEPEGGDREAVLDWVARARKTAEDDNLHRLERFFQRYVAEDLYVSGIAAIEERRHALPPRNKPAAAPAPAGGALELDPELTPPDYYEVEWHLRPGGWEGYDLYGPLFAFGVVPYVFRHGGYAAVPVGEDISQQRIDVIRQLPKPRYDSVFEPGCGGGSTLLAVRKVHPEARLTGCDLSPSLLSDGHRLAERLGAPIRFLQRDAAATGEPDAAHDAVVSYALHHELPFDANLAVLKEMFRILKPGGDIVISDPPPYRAVAPFHAALLDWDTEHREEPFFRDACAADWDAELKTIGFVDVQSYALGPNSYPWVTRATKPA